MALKLVFGPDSIALNGGDDDDDDDDEQQPTRLVRATNGEQFASFSCHLGSMQNLRFLHVTAKLGPLLPLVALTLVLLVPPSLPLAPLVVFLSWSSCANEHWLVSS